MDAFASTTSNKSIFASSDCSDNGQSVQVTVPQSGLVEVLAVVTMQANSNIVNACVNGTRVLSTNSLSQTTLYTVPGSTSGTSTAAMADWLKLFLAPGPTTIQLSFDIDGGGSAATIHDQKLIVRRST
jgi:hypothetical protein